MPAVCRTKSSNTPTTRRSSARIRTPTPSPSCPRANSKRTPSSLGRREPPHARKQSRADRQAGRKRQRDSEEDLQSPPPSRPAKRAKSSPPSPSLLNAQTLSTHTERAGYVDMVDRMGTGSDTARTPSRKGSKRASSRSSTTVGDVESASQATKDSAVNLGDYRLKNLAGSNIVFQWEPAPRDICRRVRKIIHRPIAEKRKQELAGLARTLHRKFVDVLGTAGREDDCVEPFQQALESLGYAKLVFPRKADWDPSLKPEAPPFLSLNFPLAVPDETADRPSKRQHAEDAYPSPGTLPSPGNLPYPSPDTLASPGNLAAIPRHVPDRDRGMGPPPIPALKIKTPRPDISIGLKADAVLAALQSSQSPDSISPAITITKTKARNFLRSACNGKSTTSLAATTQEVQIRFPFMPVEGKAYATGRTMYEAENQAAVSGACALGILHRLDGLVEKAGRQARSREEQVREGDGGSRGGLRDGSQGGLPSPAELQQSQLQPSASPSHHQSQSQSQPKSQSQSQSQLQPQSQSQPQSHPQPRPHQQSNSHLVFSVCTQGPEHALWAHYSTTDGDDENEDADADADAERVYVSKLLKTCHMGLSDEFDRDSHDGDDGGEDGDDINRDRDGEEGGGQREDDGEAVRGRESTGVKEITQFLGYVDNVLRWGVTEHLEAVTKRLRTVFQGLEG